MPRWTLSLLVLTTLATAAPALLFGQGDGDGSKPLPHSLSWWTRNPLRLDEDQILRIDRSVVNGHIVTARDYRVKQKITHVGTLSGHRILQNLTTIRPGPALIANGSEDAEAPPTQWKSLLMQTERRREQYVEIYKLQAYSGLYQPLTDAAIYGAGPNAILGTRDGDSGNGGGCDKGFWWFDRAGAHPVDLSPLLQAIDHARPPKSTYGGGCWALTPEAELSVWVQKSEATCHACGGLGTIEAHYRIEHGVAIPVSVLFKPDEQP